MMKKTIITICAMIMAFATFAQESSKEGMVTYEEVVKFNIQMDGMSEEMQSMLPTENRSNKILYFNEESSSYQNSKEQADNMAHSGGGIQIMMSQPDEVVFLNFADNKKVEQKEFMSRTFLIETEIKSGDWKLTGNQKMILDYPCQEATRLTEKDTISAWFTPVIQVSAGPSNYYNLPGLVLAVDRNHGDHVITAQSVELKDIEKKLIAKPKKGKKVSRGEFDKIVEEKTKEMGVEGSSGGATIIMKIGG